MRAGEFEFRHRFWFIILSFVLGYFCYHFDRLTAAQAIANGIDRALSANPGSLAARHSFQLVLAFSAFLVAAAAGVRTWAAAYLRAEVVFDTQVHSDRLVADGPYRLVRNPLYLGGLILAAGIALLYSRTGALVLLLGNWLIVLRLIGREEAALVASQGDSYRAYLAAVPKLWPSSAPRLPSGGLTPHWTQGFIGELQLWILAANGFLLAWRIDLRLYYWILAAAAVAYFLRRILIKRGWVGRKCHAA